jgi:hypothetical protein
MSYSANGMYPSGVTIYGSSEMAFLLGFAASAPTGSNLPAPTPVGRYGKTSFSASSAGGKIQGKQIPVIIGKRLGMVSFVTITAFGSAQTGMPAYGN